jgi:cation diffusion facilitator CzcD-associated flavoprotein CzcO
MNSGTVPHNQVAIVGTGFGAIATAIRLRKAGVEDFVMIDRAGEVGGVWRDNSYPGAAVDVKSHLYSLSSAPNPDWHNVFAERGELYAYLRDVADKFGLRRRLVLNCEVEEMRWDADEQRWELGTAEGPRTAQHVVVRQLSPWRDSCLELPGHRRGKLRRSPQGREVGFQSAPPSMLRKSRLILVVWTRAKP